MIQFKSLMTGAAVAASTLAFAPAAFAGKMEFSQHVYSPSKTVFSYKPPQPADPTLVSVISKIQYDPGRQSIFAGIETTSRDTVWDPKGGERVVSINTSTGSQVDLLNEPFSSGLENSYSLKFKSSNPQILFISKDGKAIYFKGDYAVIEDGGFDLSGVEKITTNGVDASQSQSQGFIAYGTSGTTFSESLVGTEIVTSLAEIVHGGDRADNTNFTYRSELGLVVRKSATGEVIFKSPEEANAYGGKLSENGRFLVFGDNHSHSTAVYDIQAGQRIADLAAPVYASGFTAGGQVYWDLTKKTDTILEYKLYDLSSGAAKELWHFELPYGREGYISAGFDSRVAVSADLSKVAIMKNIGGAPETMQTLIYDSTTRKEIYSGAFGQPQMELNTLEFWDNCKLIYANRTEVAIEEICAIDQ